MKSTAIPHGRHRPTQFRVLALSIPSKARVRLDLDASMLDQTFVRTPFVTLVYSKIDWYQWRQSNAFEQRTMLTEVYDECVEHVVLGRPLPNPAGPALTHDKGEPEPKEHDPEVAKAAMEAMKKELGW